MREQPNHTFGAQLRHYRQAAGLTQEQLAERAGLTVNGISQLERGERRSPYPHTIRALAEALGLSAEAHAAFAAATRRHVPPTLLAARTNLPPQPTLIGRGRDLALARDILLHQGARLLTLTGPGGVGKTSLALHIGAAMETDPLFSDGVVFVALATATTCQDVPLALARALGMTASGVQPLSEQVIPTLRERAQLLILDNLEHLLPGESGAQFAALLSELLAEAPDVRVLATSRERLRLRDEWVLELGGLELPQAESGPGVEQADAVRLFLERARRAAPAFTLNAEGQAAVARLCRQLEGMPLAIELAAAWIPTLAPAEIADEINRALDFLVRSDRDAPARHSSMRVALDHSWALLTSIEQRTLARLAVFAGGFDRHAAEQVAGAHLVTLTSLVDKSLLRRVELRGSTRYTLHELVRQYAAEHLQTDTENHALTSQKHTCYYADLFQQVRQARTGASAPNAHVILDRERDNIHAAWARAVAAGDGAILNAMMRGMRMLYDDRGWMLDAAALFSRAAGELRAAPLHAVRGRLLGMQAYFLVRAGQFNSARALLDEAQALLNEDAPEYAELYYNMGIIELRQGRLAESHMHFSHAHALARAHDDQFLSTWSHMWLGTLAKSAADYHSAEQIFEACAAAWQGRNFPRGEVVILAQLGEIAWSRGELDIALEHSREALRIASLARDSLGINMALTALGKLAHARGALNEARYLLGESAAGMRELGDAWLMGRALNQLARVEIERGDHGAAMRACAEIVRLAAAGEALLLAEATEGMALLCERTGDVQEAVALLIALEGGVGEAETLRRTVAMRDALLARLSPAEQAQAAKQASMRPLIEWLLDICTR